ncbi:AMP-binding protein [Azotobacter vinelandii]
MSYGELNRRANRLAHRLRELGVGPDVLVGIAVERGFEMVVGLLAILKAGGAYVPLDPEYPGERLAYMIGDSGIGLLLTQRHLQDRLPSADGAQSLFLEPDDDWLEGYGEENPANRTMPQNLAYVIYTSGSTGQPQGCGGANRQLRQPVALVPGRLRTDRGRPGAAAQLLQLRPDPEEPVRRAVRGRATAHRPGGLRPGQPSPADRKNTG